MKDTSEVITELGVEDFDTLVASADGYVLTAGARVERLELGVAFGTFGPVSLTGNELGQAIIGNAKANTLTPPHDHPKPKDPSHNPTPPPPPPIPSRLAESHHQHRPPSPTLYRSPNHTPPPS